LGVWIAVSRLFDKRSFSKRWPDAEFVQRAVAQTPVGNNIGVEFGLSDMNKPMGVSKYILVEALPDNLKGALPTVEEIESDLQQMQQQTGEAQ
jgi:hypothetical protein